MRVLRRRAVEQKTGKKRTQIYKEIAAGTFPRQVRLGPKAVGWIKSEVDFWIAQRIAHRDGAANE